MAGGVRDVLFIALNFQFGLNFKISLLVDGVSKLEFLCRLYIRVERIKPAKYNIQWKNEVEKIFGSFFKRSS